MALVLIDGMMYPDVTSLKSGGWTPLYEGSETAFGTSFRRWSDGYPGTYLNRENEHKINRGIIYSGNTVILGTAVKLYASHRDFDIISLGEAAGGNHHAHVVARWQYTTQKIGVFRGDGTLLGMSTQTFPYNAWGYVELKAIVHDTTGSFELRINGQSAVSGSNVDTRNGQSGTTDRITLGGPFNCGYNAYCDLYVCDGSGSVNNNFLGDVRVARLLPNANGDLNQFTPSAGSNFQCVDEANQDSDSTYVTGAAAGNKDLYNIENLAFTPITIFGVKTQSVLRKDDAGALTARNIIKSGSATANGTTIAPGVGYAQYTDIWEVDPQTTTAWSKAAIDSLQIGVERIS